jgi:HEAT repeat protein
MKRKMIRDTNRLLRGSAICTAALALTIVAFVGGAQAQKPSDELFTRLKTLDYHDRFGSNAVAEAIRRSGGDAEKLDRIETGLDTVISDPATTPFGMQESCRLLSQICTARSVPVLSGLLTQPRTSDYARGVLEACSDPEAGKALRLALKSTTGSIQIGIINTLGRREDQRAPGLLKFYINKPGPTADAAIAAMGKIATLDCVRLLRKLPPQSSAAGNALLTAAAKWTAPDSLNLARGVRLYQDLAAPQRPVTVRVAAMRALMVLNEPSAPAIAVNALKSGGLYLQIAAARTIGTIGEAKSVKPALQMFSTLPPSVQAVLLTAFADRKDRTAYPIMMVALASQDASVRAAAIRGIGIIGGVKALPKILSVLQHTDESDRQHAREALLNMRGEAAERGILAQFNSANPPLKKALLPVLGLRATSGSISSLISACSSEEPAEAVAAIQALGRAGSPEPLGELLKIAATSKNEDVRDAAAEAAGALCEKAEKHGADEIYRVLPIASPGGKAALYSLLAEIGDEKALTEVSAGLRSTNKTVHDAALTALAENWSDSRVLPVLLEAARTEPDKNQKAVAIRGYLRILMEDEKMADSIKADRLSEAIDISTRVEDKKRAVTALTFCRVPASLRTVRRCMESPELFQEASTAALLMAVPIRHSGKELKAMEGPEMQEALDRIIELSKDPAQKAEAKRLRGSSK